MDSDQKKGALLEAVTEAGFAADMIPFFPLFKIVFKFAQIGMTMKTK